MSKKWTAIVGGMLLVVAFLAGTTQGCGSSRDNAVDLCNQGCDKFGMCFTDPAPTAAQIQQCKAGCSSQVGSGGGATCTNEAAIVSAYKSCLGMSCETFLSCLDTIPECQGGAAGSGGGGSTGQGGGGGTGSASCSICTKANACCMAIPGGNPADCTLSATDCAASGANQATYIQGCQTILSLGMVLPDPPSDCL